MNKVGTSQKNFKEERKENTATIGQQVMNGFGGPAAAARGRHQSAKKRPPIGGMANTATGRNTQGAWANGQLPVAMQ